MPHESYIDFMWHCIIGFASYWFIIIVEDQLLVGNQFYILVFVQPMAIINENAHL
jgi:hypothetical protein